MPGKRQGDILLKMLDERVDNETYGRIYADLTDLVEASKWLIDTVEFVRQDDLTQDELETLLINIDISFVQHVTFHLKTFRKDINRYLASCPE